MKIVGLITEYNPFHNGHLYHIRKAKEITGADAVIVVMSGNFVQRGAPAIMPKHIRAEVALEAGVPLVLEQLPHGSCLRSRRSPRSGASGLLFYRKRGIFCRRGCLSAGASGLYRFHLFRERMRRL